MKQRNQPRTTFKTDRIEVIREGVADYSLFVDAEYIRSFSSQNDAIHAGAMILEEIARDIAAGLVGQAGVLV